MSFVSQRTDRASQAKAAIAVGAFHAVLAVGLVTGLTITGVVTSDDPFESIFYAPEETPPPPPPPPPDTSVEKPIETVVAPPIPLPLPPVSENLTETTTTIPDTPVGPVFVDPGKYTPVKPVSPPGLAPVNAKPSNNPGGWVTNDDYSRADIIRNREGRASFRLVVGSNGRAEACEITSSTGHQSLDDQTCKLVTRRARFDAATNEAGEKVVGTYSGSIVWRIPE
jgi:protein TonB